jgi:hypothetical protein
MADDPPLNVTVRDSHLAMPGMADDIKVLESDKSVSANKCSGTRRGIGIRSIYDPGDIARARGEEVRALFI